MPRLCQNEWVLGVADGHPRTMRTVLDLQSSRPRTRTSKPDKEEVAEGVSNELSNDPTVRQGMPVDAGGRWRTAAPRSGAQRHRVARRGFGFGTKRPLALPNPAVVTYQGGSAPRRRTALPPSGSALGGPPAAGRLHRGPAPTDQLRLSVILAMLPRGPVFPAPNCPARGQRPKAASRRRYAIGVAEP
jgi:hypothetical protein